MTRLRIMSDLHLEFGPLNLEPIGEDVLVLAGDIGVHTQGALWAADYSRRTGVPVVMIAGNHEFYRQRGNPEEYTVASTLRALRRCSALHFLEMDHATVEGVSFLGTTLWTDYALYGNALVGKLVAAGQLNDHQLIYTERGKFTVHDADARHFGSRLWLAANLPANVVVTHHLPSIRSVSGRYGDSPLNAAYASNLDELVAGAKLWVHGHTHVWADYMIGDTRVVCNPRGYWPHALNPDFDPNFIVEIEACPSKARDP